MPTKPKPTTVKPSAPKAEPSLYKAIREHLETKDRETLHARTTKAVEAVENLLESGRSVEVVNVTNIVNQAATAPAAPWSLDGLVVDPGVEAVGEYGLTWDNTGWLRFTQCKGYNMELSHPYETPGRNLYEHFAFLPNFPGAELLKRITGYEAT